MPWNWDRGPTGVPSNRAVLESSCEREARALSPAPGGAKTNLSGSDCLTLPTSGGPLSWSRARVLSLNSAWPSSVCFPPLLSTSQVKAPVLLEREVDREIGRGMGFHDPAMAAGGGGGLVGAGSAVSVEGPAWWQGSKQGLRWLRNRTRRCGGDLRLGFARFGQGLDERSRELILGLEPNDLLELR